MSLIIGSVNFTLSTLICVSEIAEDLSIVILKVAPLNIRFTVALDHSFGSLGVIFKPCTVPVKPNNPSITQRYVHPTVPVLYKRLYSN